MKIGLLTFNWAINYGAILQMYALYRRLSKSNEVFIINYVPDYLANIYSTKIFVKPLKIKSMIRKALEKPIKYKQIQKFKEFINTSMLLTNKAKNREELTRIINALDVVVVGSDQVWNYDITKDYLRDYLLNGINCNKISYAASIGKNHIKPDLVNLFRESLEDFDFISLREKNAINYLSEIYRGKDYKLCVDPVFLLNKEEWETIANKSEYKLPAKEYILVYMLENNLNLINIAKNLSRIYNLPVISVEIPFLRLKPEMRGIRKLHDVGPIDFIKLLLNSKWVFTNSFHGTAFSLIFNKEFVTFSHSTVNERIDNLLKLYGVENNQIRDGGNITVENIIKILQENKCASIKQNHEILKLIEESKEYLMGSIESIKNLKLEKGE